MNEDYIIPGIDQREVFPGETQAVRMKAIEQGAAGMRMTLNELYRRAESTIRKARESAKLPLENGMMWDFAKKFSYYPAYGKEHRQGPSF